jgi:hypothetical protein
MGYDRYSLVWPGMAGNYQVTLTEVILLVMNVTLWPKIVI